jgi:hypothetical protein
MSLYLPALLFHSLGNEPEADIDFRTWTPQKSRRLVAIDYNMKSKAVKVHFPK